MLIISFLRTIFEDPKAIPDDYEWDMGSESHSDIESSLVQRQNNYLN